MPRRPNAGAIYEIGSSVWVITHRNNIENVTYDTLAGRIMWVDIATGAIPGAMESLGGWID